MNININTVIILGLASIVSTSFAQRMVCYYGSWSVYRHGPAKFEVEDINPKLCTHLIFSFVGLNQDGTVKILDPWNDVGDQWHEGAFQKLQKLRRINPKLKIMCAIGGWNVGSKIFSDVVNDPKKRQVFVESILQFTITHKFDGFDLDWEYPNQRGGKPSDKQAFSDLIAELKKVYEGRRLVLSAAVSANILNCPDSYDCKALAKYLDFINILSYDLHGSWEKVVGHHTALFPHPEEYYKHLNVKTALEYWVKCTGAPDKINIGLAFYGRTFTLADPREHKIGAPAIGPGPAGQYVQEAGFLPFNEICVEQSKGLWQVYEVPEQSVKYAVKNNIWVGYDDTETITKKLQLAKQLNLGGAMIWSIETDDFRGDCGWGKYPLLHNITKQLNLEGQESKPTPTTDRTPTPKPDEGYSSLCKFCGHLFKHPTDPNSFFMCTYSDGTNLMAVLFRCPNDLVFNEDVNVCTPP